MAENRFQPSSSASTARGTTLRRPIAGTTPSLARTGKSESNSISSIGSFPPLRVSHGVYMRPIDAPKYRNTRKCSFDAIQETNFGESGTNVTAISEIGVEVPDPELEKLWVDIDQYVVDLVAAEEPGKVHRVRGGTFKIPNSVVRFGERSGLTETHGGKRGKTEGISQSHEVRKFSGDHSQSQPGNQIGGASCRILGKPTGNVMAYKNSEKLDCGGNKLAGELDLGESNISTRAEMRTRASDFELKARDEGKSLKRPSEGTVSGCTRKILVHGSDTKCRNSVHSESHKVPRISTQVQKYRRLSDLEFQAKKQRSEEGRVVVRPFETAIDYAHNSVGIQKPFAKSKFGSMKHGTPFQLQPLGLLGTSKLSNLGKLSLWDKLKHRSCRRTLINCPTSRKEEEMHSLAGDRRIRTCHSSTDRNRAECSRPKLVEPLNMVVGDQSFIKKKQCLKHDTKDENFQLENQSSCASSDHLPLVTQRSHDTDEIGARDRVKDTLLRFRALCGELSKEGVRRVDCEAANQIKRSRDIYIPAKLIGHVPGIKIGDEFLYRMEISIVGLHKPPQAGIDFLRHETYDICTSIVASGCGGYANDIGNTEYLIYSGHGGACSRIRKEPVDQELQQGNLALKNSTSIKNPVRVIRGNKEVGEGGKVRSIYIYDGLYQVESFWQEKAPYGKLVYKFKLVRMPGQRKLSQNQWVKLGRH